MKNQRFVALCLCGFLLIAFAPTVAQARSQSAKTRLKQSPQAQLPHRRPGKFWTNKEAVVQVLQASFESVTDAYGVTTMQMHFNGIGTGFVVNVKGLVVTNNHVVEISPKKEAGIVNPFINPSPTAPEIFVCMVKAGVRECKKAEVLATDPEKDLALLRTEWRFRRAVIFADENELLPGDQIYLWGNVTTILPPSPFFGTYIGRLEPPYLKSDKVPFLLPMLLADINVSYGSSGGVAFDELGRCIGVIIGFVPDHLLGSRAHGLIIPSSVHKEFYKKNRPKPKK